MKTNFIATLPDHIPSNETIVLPISMNQHLEQGERLAAIIKSIRAQGYENRTTLLICDYLNRHNCTAAQALEQGESFLQEGFSAYRAQSGNRPLSKLQILHS